MIVVALLLWSSGIALGTWLVGWWALPLIALAAGATGRRPTLVALDAAIAWAALLGFDAMGGRLGVLTSLLGGIFPVPGPALVLLTLLFAAALAWSAAELTKKRVTSNEDGVTSTE
jgi:hypothetical protein